MISDQYIGVTRGGTENEYEKSYNDKFIETCKIETTQNYPTIGKDIKICNLRVIKKTGSIQRFVTIYNTYLQSDFFSSEFTIKMKLRNPDDNFPRDNQLEVDKAFKIRTFTFDFYELSKSNDVEPSIKS